MVKYCIRLDVMKAIIVYIAVAVFSNYLFQKIGSIADDYWFWVTDKVFLAFTAIYWIITIISIIYKKVAKKWQLIGYSMGLIVQNSEGRMQAVSYKKKQSITQWMFGLCTIVFKNRNGRKLKLKNVSLKKLRRYGIR